MTALERHPWRVALADVDDLRVRFDEPLARYTSYKIGGPADAFVYADTRDQLRRVAAIARAYDVSMMPLGRGSNLLISDDGIRGIVFKLGREFEEIEFDGLSVACGAPIPMSVLSKECAKLGLSGAEFMFGIPGSVGGGVRMNAGAHGTCMEEIVVAVEALDWGGEIQRLDKDALGFRYRDSRLGEFVCATVCHFEMEAADPVDVELLTKEYYHQRLTTQPLALPSAGCVFRNPDVSSAGRLIDECGLKGLSVGGVRVSEKHANFLVASEGATAADALALIREVRRFVKEKTGVELQLEIKILGEGVDLSDLAGE